MRNEVRAYLEKQADVIDITTGQKFDFLELTTAEQWNSRPDNATARTETEEFTDVELWDARQELIDNARDTRRQVAAEIIAKLESVGLVTQTERELLESVV